MLFPEPKRTKCAGTAHTTVPIISGRFIASPTSLRLWYGKRALPIAFIIRSLSQQRVHGSVHLAITAVISRGE
jgi:hypothetical protein